ncbi:glycoside hydrolase superfamily [Emericellopsis atlantica]|uniref:Glycoside hydrolase superfamily n=1 Tax=Emericellopsis atlantica TaxID=2614577 RepID=A0A9P7ZFT8_9HYPO|nr:glycoside hydrolase superfamily [Emericellopsis atlantica]KAG9251333.1 glycoside hydrolase superfamily [Emericellopsis atlantica]
MHSAWSSSLAVAALWASCIVHAQTPYKVQTPPLDTDWTYTVGTDPWPEHPRPQLRREAWQSLNGLWTWRAAASPGDVGSPPKAGPLDREVLVPSCIESGLSGLQILDVRDMWYETTFDVPSDWKGQQVLLNFEAVDYEATVFVNGVKKTTHVGGYARFTVDVTDNVKFGGSNDLLVFVSDPTDSAVIPVGKQTLNPSHIFYRSCSGIWQQVWIESAPKDHISRLDVAADMDGQVTVNVLSSAQKSANVEVKVFGRNGSEIASQTGSADEQFTFTVENPDLWWPDSPTLYNLTVTLGDDEVNSYTGFRTISKGEVEGVMRHLLNGEFVFQFGTLDQGYWPDGLHTPPSREAMVYDLQVLKNFGMNMLRKHIKIEPDLFYEACDRMGLLVIQDMPALSASKTPNDEEQAEFQRQLELMINEHKSYPSIYSWVIYNEGWGQRNSDPAPEGGLTEVIRKLDPTRLINSISGWNDHGYGDYHDNHNYAHPQCGTPFYSRPKTPYDPERIGFQGEYGGIGHNVSIEHLWNVQAAIDTIPETYEINEDLASYSYRSMVLFRDLREQTERYACSGAVYTQTTDVEGEVNGLLTYDRRFMRPDLEQWQEDIQSLYEAAASRGGRPVGGDAPIDPAALLRHDTMQRLQATRP